MTKPTTPKDHKCPMDDSPAQCKVCSREPRHGKRPHLEKGLDKPQEFSKEMDEYDKTFKHSQFIDHVAIKAFILAKLKQATQKVLDAIPCEELKHSTAMDREVDGYNQKCKELKEFKKQFE